MTRRPAAAIPPFAWVTSAGGLVIALSGLVDALTSTGDAFGSAWTWGSVALNRSGLDERVDVELGRAARSGAPLTVGIIDLIGFKQVNDEHGHAEGDRLLVSFASVLREQTRPSDTVARIGGDEFLVLMPDTAAPRATDLFERLRVSTGGHWSYGLAEAVAADSARTIRARADRELYAQKVMRRRARESRPDPSEP